MAVVIPSSLSVPQSAVDRQMLDYYRADTNDKLALAAQDPEFMANLVLETGAHLTETDMLWLRDQREAAGTMQNYVLQFIQECERDVCGQFSRIAQVGNETIDFYIGHQLSNDDEARVIAEGRKPYVFNEMKAIVNATLGEAVEQRTDWRANPMNGRSAAKTEIFNKALRWVAQDNRVNGLKADWLRDDLLYGFGVAGSRMHPLDPEGRIQVLRYRPQEFMYELNSAVNSPNEAAWWWRGSWQDRMFLAAKYPEVRAQILSAAALMTATSGLEKQYAMMRPKVRVPANERSYTESYDPVTRQLWGRLLFVREFYVKRYVQKLVITDPFSGTTFPCPNADVADQQRRACEQFYMQTPVWGMLSEQLRGRLFTPRYVQMECIDQFILIGDQLVRVNKDDEGGLPFVFSSSGFYNGDVTPYFDHLKAPNRWINRLSSFIDELQAGAKGGMIVNLQYKPPDMSDDEFRNMFNKPNWKLLVNEIDPTAELSKIVHYVSEQQNGQVVAPLLQYMENLLDKMGGGRTRTGMPAFAGQSGKSAQEMLQAGSLLTKGALAKFRDSDTELGQRTMSLLQYLHPATVMRVYDDESGPEFFSFWDQGIESPSDYLYDIQVAEVVASPTERQARINRLLDLMGYVPGIAPHVMDFVMKNADIEYSERRAIMQGIEADRQAASAMQQRQMEMDYEEMHGKLEVQQTGMYLKGRQQAWIEKNAPKIIMNSKTSFGPATEATVLNWAGIGVGLDADPSQVIADRATNALINQSAITMQQVEESLHTPEWQREAIRAKIAVKQGFPSAKDSANRHLREVRGGRSNA